MKNKLTVALKNLDLVIASGLFVVTLLIVVLNVFSRYFCNYVFPWGEEIATSCFVYTVFIGAAWCLRTQQHMGVDLVVKNLPGSVRRVIQLITDILVAVLNGYITYLSVLYIWSSRIKTMPILKVSSVYLNVSLFVGFALMTIYSAAKIVKDLKSWNKSGKEEVR